MGSTFLPLYSTIHHFLPLRTIVNHFPPFFNPLFCEKNENQKMSLLFTVPVTSNASRRFKSPLAMGEMPFKIKRASSVPISAVIDTGVNSNKMSTSPFCCIHGNKKRDRKDFFLLCLSFTSYLTEKLLINNC